MWNRSSLEIMTHIKRTLSLLRCYRHQVTRACSSLLSDSSMPGLVLHSQSTDVFHNLALENWIDTHVDLQQRSILLLWRNQPAVVIGRHQNPWMECSLPAMRRAGIALARRHSGGGTVFHDLGNLNLTFFTSKTAYNRQRNLKVITEALRKLQPGLEVHATERLDILLKGHYKISGTASRLSRRSSYHHCTLLHSADRSTLAGVLRPTCPSILSNATPSVPSPVANLVDHIPNLKWQELLNMLAAQYNAEFGLTSPMVLINPDDVSAFPGLSDIVTGLRSWEWTFGKTPKFSIQMPLALADHQQSSGSPAELRMEVKNGVIESCELDVPVEWMPQRLSSQLSSVLLGERFCPHRVAAAASVLLQSEKGNMHKKLHQLCDAVVAVMG